MATTKLTAIKYRGYGGSALVRSTVEKQDGCLLRPEAKAVFQNMAEFVPRPYLAFNEACSGHIKPELHHELSLEP